MGTISAWYHLTLFHIWLQRSNLLLSWFLAEKDREAVKRIFDFYYEMRFYDLLWRKKIWCLWDGYRANDYWPINCIAWLFLARKLEHSNYALDYASLSFSRYFGLDRVPRRYRYWDQGEFLQLCMLRTQQLASINLSGSYIRRSTIFRAITMWILHIEQVVPRKITRSN